MSSLMSTSVIAPASPATGSVEVTLETWDDMIHVWQAFVPFLPEAGQAITGIGAWLGERLARR